MMNWIRTYGARLVGIGAAIVGPVIVLGAVVVMNELSQAPDKVAAAVASTIEVTKAPKPKPKIQQPKPRPKKAKPRTPPPPALANLTSGLGGVDVGLPGLEQWDLDMGAGGVLGNTGDVVHTGESVDEQPKATRRAPMQYPPALRRKGVEGYVVLSLLVSVSGVVEQAKVIESSPSGSFDAVALAGVREWQFAPGRYNGEPVRSWVRQRITFDLQS